MAVSNFNHLLYHSWLMLLYHWPLLDGFCYLSLTIIYTRPSESLHWPSLLLGVLHRSLSCLHHRIATTNMHEESERVGTSMPNLIASDNRAVHTFTSRERSRLSSVGLPLATRTPHFRTAKGLPALLQCKKLRSYGQYPSPDESGLIRRK